MANGADDQSGLLSWQAAEVGATAKTTGEDNGAALRRIKADLPAREAVRKRTGSSSSIRRAEVRKKRFNHISASALIRCHRTMNRVEIVRHCELTPHEIEPLRRRKRVDCDDLHQRLSSLRDDERLTFRRSLSEARQVSLGVGCSRFSLRRPTLNLRDIV
jgi:hypothetical protein